MSESPIGKLLEIANVGSPRAPVPLDDPRYLFERFEDLEIGLVVYVKMPGRTWHVGSIYKIGDDPRGRLRATVKMADIHGSSFFYAYRWEQYRDGRFQIRRAEPLAGRAVLERDLRQAAKPMNFSGSKSGLIDGMTPDAILETYTRIQREQEPPYVITGPDAQRVPRLTPAQLICARALWAHDVRVAVRRSGEEAARRERERVVVDDDRWEI